MRSAGLARGVWLVPLHGTCRKWDARPVRSRGTLWNTRPRLAQWRTPESPGWYSDSSGLLQLE